MATRDELFSSFIKFQKDFNFILERANITHTNFFSWIEKISCHKDAKLVDKFLFRGPDCFLIKVRNAKFCWDKYKDLINWEHALIMMKSHSEVQIMKEFLSDIKVKWMDRPIKKNRRSE